MVQRKRKNCPIPGCFTLQLKKLSNHLSSVHLLNSNERKFWLQQAKLKNSYSESEQSFNNQSLTEMDVSIKSPSNLLLSGATKAGKTFFTRQLLLNANEVFDKPIEKVLYCYGAFQPLFLDMQREIPNIEFIEGFPENLDSYFKGKPGILVVDDLLNSCINNASFVEHITKGTHHKGITTIFLVQNLFPGGKHGRTISLNCHYIFVFKNPRDCLGIQNLARQAFPGATKFVLES